MPLISLGSGLPIGLVQAGIPGRATQGVPAATLQLWLASAQAAYAELQSGSKIASASYSQGDGSRSVTYTASSIVGLRSWIQELQRALGMASQSRRPMTPYFR